MLGHWEYRTSLGVFRIVPYFCRYRAMYEDENLGSYATPRAAVDELCGGSTLAVQWHRDIAMRATSEFERMEFRAIAHEIAQGMTTR
jgi:hypothetical protein